VRCFARPLILLFVLPLSLILLLGVAAPRLDLRSAPPTPRAVTVSQAEVAQSVPARAQPRHPVPAGWPPPRAARRGGRAPFLSTTVIRC